MLSRRAVQWLALPGRQGISLSAETGSDVGRSRLGRPTHRRHGDRRPRRISLQTLLPATLAVLVVIAVAPVIALGYGVANNTAERLLRERAELIVDNLEHEIRGQLDPVVAQMTYARQAVASGQVDARDPSRMRDFALGLMAGTPQVIGVGVLGQDLSMRRWERSSFAEIVEPPERLPFAGMAVDAAQNGVSAYWASPFYSVVLGDALLNYRVALEQDGVLLGVLTAGVTGESLSRYVTETSRRFGVTAFVLAGRERVVSYPGQRAPRDDPGSIDLPRLVDVADPVVAGLWNDPRPFTQIADPQRSQGHWSRVEGEPYAYFYRELTDYGPEPLIVAVATLSADTRRDRWAARVAAGAGVVLMLVAVAVAWQWGRRLSHQVAGFDRAMNHIARLEFDRVSLPAQINSRIREWHDMARRMEGTARALSAFQTYLPRALVRRLFEAADGGVVSEERHVTVMFADLEGFTRFADGRAAGEVAAHLNEVFGLIGPIVEASGGVIDKYTGDGMLAFWGAPDAQPDHAHRACSAAAEIAQAVEQRAASAPAPMPRLRIGLHCGLSIVGNIGFPGRIDYTLVGDTVNVAERTQTALRGIQPDRAAVIGATPEVLDGQDPSRPALIRGDVLPGMSRPAYVCHLPGDVRATGASATAPE